MWDTMCVLGVFSSLVSHKMGHYAHDDRTGPLLPVRPEGEAGVVAAEAEGV